MKVSIVTISFNQVRYIEEAIRSVIEQDYDDLEYVLVDPGSTDGSRQIIDRYRRRISKIIFEPDNGAADGLNKGFSHATGEIYGFINADDRLLKGAVRTVVDAFQRDPKADVIYGNGYVVDDLNKVLRKVYADPFNRRRFAYGCFTFTQPSVFFRKEAFDEVGGFNSANRTCWDAELLAEFSLRGKRFRHIDAFLSCFRLHKESISGSRRLQAAYEEDWQRLFSKLTQRPRAWYDGPAMVLARLEKWVMNPASLAHNILNRVLAPVRAPEYAPD